MNYWNLTFSTRLRQALPHGMGSTHTKNRTQIEVMDQKISRFRPGTVGGHTFTLRLIVTIDIWSRMWLVVRTSWNTRRAFHWCFDPLLAMPRGNGVPNLARQNDLIWCLGVWSTISWIHKFRYCVHPESISVICIFHKKYL